MSVILSYFIVAEIFKAELYKSTRRRLISFNLSDQPFLVINSYLTVVDTSAAVACKLNARIFSLDWDFKKLSFAASFYQHVISSLMILGSSR